MQRTYTTRQGDMLDEIVFSVYGRTAGIVEGVLEANRGLGLADIGPVFPAGISIILPDVEVPAAQTVKLVRLWE